MTTPDIHALVGAYALDAVDDLERAAFERHIAACEGCHAEVGELRETASRLADSTWSVPPPRLRTDVLAAAAAVVGVLGIGAAATTYAVQEQRLDDQRTAVAQAQQQADRIQAVLAAPDAALHASDLNGGGRVTVVVSDTQDAGVVVLADAPPPGPDRAYQLWLVPTGSTTPVSAGLLPAGQAQATELIQGVRGRAMFAVSLEPAGGSPAPSTTPLVGISLV